MNMIVSRTFAFLFVALFQEVASLKDVVLDIQPRIVEFGKESKLRCSYDLEHKPLYSVKWYRGQFEFYRFTPKELPNTMVFRIDGLDVDESRSNEHQVVLRNIGFNLSGNFSCEVTTDEPSFAAITVIKDMLVVVLPKSPPSLTTDKSFYEVGDVLRANCSSPQSRPAATHTFILNNIVVFDKSVTKKIPDRDLIRTESFLELVLSPNDFHNGRLTLKCVAQMGDLYQQDTDITFTNVKDPIPARVTQTSSRAAVQQIIIYMFIVLIPISINNL
uniref:Ig-like domain-containing protein n=1 Tax=Dendroctonus ponderosae TaxID=77166 RepID=A0AAR5PRI6_DENPD